MYANYTNMRWNIYSQDMLGFLHGLIGIVASTYYISDYYNFMWQINIKMTK